MRDYLYGSTTVITTAFFGKNRPVNFTGCDITLFGETFVNETLIMSQVQIGFRTVIGDEYFTMLNWIHRTRVNIDIRVKFLHGYFVATHFQQST